MQWCKYKPEIDSVKIEKVMGDQLNRVKVTIESSKSVPSFMDAIKSGTDDEDDW